jgi:hypothetical protein
MANTRKRLWYIDKLGKLGIIEESVNAVTKNGVTTNWTSITEAKPFRIYATSLAEDISINNLDGSFSEIPAQFHEAILYKVIANLYRDVRNKQFDSAQYFDTEYSEGVKRARKFSKSNYTSTGFIKPQDF